ncbi:GntR family transcriptional regulator [Amycolatopsis rifamycinica]|uniref:GntR family transcriptional regulator n=1 Tax=Amycolatopsis rifamycinica TaxID=287986 RepID=A0A066U2I8_9PSEU|nr:GntR family transcriptional regulator [Amycolatopsis rifamycinica]KDN20077.1 GntR family transcriptional regulator [Amycolatopsis rifamycinica]
MPAPSRLFRLSADGPVLDGIPEHGRVPRYYAVKVELLAVIAELGEGAVLPTERELCERFEVSRATVRQAVAELVLEGRLSRRQGSGTYIAGPKLVQPLAPTGRRPGIRPGRTAITLERRPAGRALAADLRVTSDAEVFHLERVLLAGDERVGLESTYLLASRCPDLLEVFVPEQPLNEQLGVEPAGAEERVETVLATPREALLIGTNPALPMLLTHRISWGPDGVPFERVRSLYRGDRLSFTTRLGG